MYTKIVVPLDGSGHAEAISLRVEVILFQERREENLCEQLPAAFLTSRSKGRACHRA